MNRTMMAVAAAAMALAAAGSASAQALVIDGPLRRADLRSLLTMPPIIASKMAIAKP